MVSLDDELVRSVFGSLLDRLQTARGRLADWLGRRLSAGRSEPPSAGTAPSASACCTATKVFRICSHSAGAVNREGVVPKITIPAIILTAVTVLPATAQSNVAAILGKPHDCIIQPFVAGTENSAAGEAAVLEELLRGP